MSVQLSLPLLDQVDVASPCPARWEDMTGDERVRHCAQCNLRVHNISAMPGDEAEALLRETIGQRLCIRLYRRADGTIITQDCPVGLARVRRRVRWAVVRAAALIGLVGAAGVSAGAASRNNFGERVRLRAMKPFSIVCEWIAPSSPIVPMPVGIRAWAGERYIPVRPTTQPGAPVASPAAGGIRNPGS